MLFGILSIFLVLFWGWSTVSASGLCAIPELYSNKLLVAYKTVRHLKTDLSICRQRYATIWGISRALNIEVKLDSYMYEYSQVYIWLQCRAYQNYSPDLELKKSGSKNQLLAKIVHSTELVSIAHLYNIIHRLQCDIFLTDNYYAHGLSGGAANTISRPWRLLSLVTPPTLSNESEKIW